MPNVEGTWRYNKAKGINCFPVEQECKQPDRLTGRDQPRVLIDNKCCNDKNYNEVCDDEEFREITCPSDLLDKEFKFFDSPTGVWYKNMIVDDNIRKANDNCVKCTAGFEEGQNINYNYCEDFLYGPIINSEGYVQYEDIYVQLVLKDSYKDAGRGNGGRLFTQGQCGTVPDVDGVWRFADVVDITCYEYDEFYRGFCGDGACRDLETCSTCDADCG